MPERPSAVKIKSELGLPGTISAGPNYFLTIRDGPFPVFLGLGPDPAILQKMYPDSDQFFYIECPELESQLGPSWRQRIPENYTKVEPDQLNPEDIQHMGFVLYFPGLKYFPGFWTDVLARVRLAPGTPGRFADKPAIIYIFGNEKSLLVPELYWETESLGLRPVLVSPEPGPDELSRLLAEKKPAFALSVNLQGMDPLGENFALFNRLNIPVALWMVDNPFHLLTGIKGRYWNRACIFVTDDWFIEPLNRLGAQNVYHLPLAAGPGFFRSTGKGYPDLNDKVVFVGRSSFPGSRSFFAAAAGYPRLESQIPELLNNGHRTDFAWWHDKISTDLWPGNKVRDTGLGAERAGLVWKKMCLQALEDSCPLVVYGDPAWKNILAGRVQIRPEVDYYGPLASIYSSSKYVLNLTGMHLPRGLTQRHFDVWAAKGFLITDKTRGLEIFPHELAREISFSTPGEMLELLTRLDNDRVLKEHLVSGFRNLIIKKHTYRHRLERILNLMEINF